VSYQVELSVGAQRYLHRLDQATQRRIGLRIDHLVQAPYGRDSKALRGRRSLRSSRVGEYRIIFTVYDETQTVFVNRIGPRGQVYRGL
jgi:mRNA interferase RelE/StbE